ncbi:MAG: phosphate ABC transporter permease subunit PstC [Thermoplasmata archaeon]
MSSKKGSRRSTLVRSSIADPLFKYFTMGAGLAVIALSAYMVSRLMSDAWLSIAYFRGDFLTGTVWDPRNELYSALPFIFGTLTTSAVAMLIGVPLSVGIAIYLSELAPAWIREPLSFLVELLAAVPSVIYGLWAMYALRPVLMNEVEPFLQDLLGWTPFFQGTAFGIDRLAAGIILAIMIIPTVASVSKESLMAVPDSQREAALSLGATRYETTRMAVLTYARSGIFGAIILGLGRAVGETMAVTMTIGNANMISWSLLDPGQTMASIIANNWQEAEGLMLSALIEIGVVLFFVALIVNMIARVMVSRVLRAIPMTGGGL